MEARTHLLELLANGLTQAEITKETGIPQATLSRIKRGKNKDVSSGRAEKLHALWKMTIKSSTELTEFQNLEVVNMCVNAGLVMVATKTGVFRYDANNDELVPVKFAAPEAINI